MNWLRIMVLFALLEGAFLPAATEPEEGESPHFNENACGECHGRARPEGEAATIGPLDYYNSLCIDCHAGPPVVCSFHSNMEPKNDAIARLSGPFDLKTGRILCLTCHDAAKQCTHERKEETHPLFLRGDPTGPAARFCFACHHPEQFRIRKIHQADSEEGEDTCLFCHEEASPGPQAHVDVESVCTVCHQTGPHPGGKDHLVRIEAYTLKKDLPLVDGDRITCTTCHDPHASSRKPGLLRTQEDDDLCSFCHDEEEGGARDR